MTRWAKKLRTEKGLVGVDDLLLYKEKLEDGSLMHFGVTLGFAHMHNEDVGSSVHFALVQRCQHIAGTTSWRRVESEHALVQTSHFCATVPYIGSGRSFIPSRTL